MRLKVEQIYSGPNPVALVSNEDQKAFEISVGSQLRCGGYRFTVVSVNGAASAAQKGLELTSPYGLRPGMILRPVGAPLSDQEFCSMLARAGQILQELAELDAETTCNRLKSANSDVDRLLEFLNRAGVKKDFVNLFSELKSLKQCLPDIAKQRSMGRVADEMNNQLGVIELKERRADVGS